MPGDHDTQENERDRSSKTIFLIEDDTDSARYLLQMLKTQTSHYVFLISDIRKALDIARSIPPDLFLLDARSTHMDGQDFQQRLHDIPGLKHIPTLYIHGSIRKRDETPFQPLTENGQERPKEYVRSLLHTIQELL